MLFQRQENIVFFITMLAYFEKYGMIKDKSSTLQCENVTQEEKIMAYEITGHTVLTGLLGVR